MIGGGGREWGKWRGEGGRREEGEGGGKDRGKTEIREEPQRLSPLAVLGFGMGDFGENINTLT